VQNGDANDLFLLVPDQNVVVRQLRVTGMAWFLEVQVQVQHIGFRVVAGPDGLIPESGAFDDLRSALKARLKGLPRGL
jgi:hypothetical protein